MTVTRLPKRLRAWAISSPTWPPPKTRRCFGTRSNSRASMCVIGRDSARPGIGSIRAREPVQITTTSPRRVRVPSSAVTSIVLGPTKRPCPLTSSAPLSRYALTLTDCPENRPVNKLFRNKGLPLSERMDSYGGPEGLFDRFDRPPMGTHRAAHAQAEETGEEADRGSARGREWHSAHLPHRPPAAP